MNLKWIAYYEDGKRIQEHEQSYWKLVRQGLIGFQLVLESGESKVMVCLKDGKSLFYRIRTFGLNTSRLFSVYLVGWRRRNGSGVEQEFFIVHEDGRVTEHNKFGEHCLEPEWQLEEQV